MRPDKIQALISPGSRVSGGVDIILMVGCKLGLLLCVVTPAVVKGKG